MEEGISISFGAILLTLWAIHYKTNDTLWKSHFGVHFAKGLGSPSAFQTFGSRRQLLKLGGRVAEIEPDIWILMENTILSKNWVPSCESASARCNERENCLSHIVWAVKSPTENEVLRLGLEIMDFYYHSLQTNHSLGVLIASMWL